MTRWETLKVALEKTTYYADPASSCYHLHCYGGLAIHSEHVATNLQVLTQNMSLTWQDQDSPLIIGYGHDLCKIGAYLWDEDKQIYTPNADHPKGHGDMSVLLLKSWIDLTPEEENCIRWHMGAFDDCENWSRYTKAIKQFPNVLWTHTADMMATFIDEKDL